MRIGWDLDGVEHYFERGFYDVLVYFESPYATKMMEKYPNFEVDTWNWYREFDMSDKEFLDLCHRGADLGILFRGHHVPGGAESMARLRRLGHTIHIITDRSFGTDLETSQELTRQFLEQGGYEYDTLTFSRDKTCVPTDYFIDDKIENYDALDAVGTKVYLLDQRWNRRTDRERRRVVSTAHFADIVQFRRMLSSVN